MKALIVDEDPDVRELIAFTLAHVGYSVVNASSAVQALEQWCLQAPDVVVLEPALRRSDGLVVCRTIRQASTTPVILVSSKGSEQDVLDGFAAGASDYLVKPFSPRQLLLRIAKLHDHNTAGLISVGPGA